MNEVDFKPRPSVQQRIEEAAMRLIADSDVSDLTFVDIAAAAHCSLQTLYRYYGSIENLWLACTRRMLKGLGDRMLDHLHGIEGYKDKLRKVFWLILDFFERNESSVEFFLSSVRIESWMHDESFRQAEVTRTMMTMIMEGQQRRILTKEVDVATIMDFIYGLLARLMQMRRLRRGQPSNAARANVLFEMLWRAIANPENSSDTVI